MVHKDIVFGATEVMTPDFAARLAHQASQFDAEITIGFGSTQLCVDSLISLLSMNLRKGMRIKLSADGSDEKIAIECIATALEAAQ